MTLLSIVVPCFNEEENVDIYYEAVTKVLNTKLYSLMTVLEIER